MKPVTILSALAIILATNLCFQGLANSATSPIRVALTVDDLPRHGEIADERDRIEIAKNLLVVLKRHKIPEVFGFVNGERIDKDKSLLRVLEIWLENGYPLGNHTYSHVNLSLVSASDFELEIQRGEDALKKVDKRGNFKLFRYPFLHEGDSIEKREQIRNYLKANGYKYAPVTLDYKDYLFNAPLARCTRQNNFSEIKKLEKLQFETVARLIDHQIDKAKEILGTSAPHILLIHIGASNAKWFDKIATMLERKGVQWIPLSEALKDPAYEVDPAVEINSGGLFTAQMARFKKIDFASYPEENKLETTLESFCN